LWYSVLDAALKINTHMDKNDTTENKTLFDDLGLSLGVADVQVGQTYPIYGAITKFVSEELGNVVIEINENIQATLNIQEQDKLDVLKNRAFDVGIFICIITDLGPTIQAQCSTVIFGKNNEHVQ